MDIFVPGFPEKRLKKSSGSSRAYYSKTVVFNYGKKFPY
jgi:hypothetical protein